EEDQVADLHGGGEGADLARAGEEGELGAGGGTGGGAAAEGDGERRGEEEESHAREGAHAGPVGQRGGGRCPGARRARSSESSTATDSARVLIFASTAAYSVRSRASRSRSAFVGPPHGSPVRS